MLLMAMAGRAVWTVSSLAGSIHQTTGRAERGTFCFRGDYASDVVKQRGPPRESARSLRTMTTAGHSMGEGDSCSRDSRTPCLSIGF